MSRSFINDLLQAVHDQQALYTALCAARPTADLAVSERIEVNRAGVAALEAEPEHFWSMGTTRPGCVGEFAGIEVHYRPARDVEPEPWFRLVAVDEG